MNFKNKVAIVTGATGGIGAEVAKQLASAGAKLCLVDLDMAKLKELALDLELSDDDYLVQACDVRKESLVEAYVAATKEKFGRIDVFVNNAGVEGNMASIEATNLEDLNFVLDVNIRGAFFGLKYVLPIMYEQKAGRVINTASVAGLIGFPNLSPYVASKHAILGITKTAALEAASHGVTVNAVCPGPVDNNMMRNIEKKSDPDNAEAVQANFKQMIPIGRYASNADVAHMILFFASDEAGYITGTTQRVDGGMGAK